MIGMLDVLSQVGEDRIDEFMVALSEQIEAEKKRRWRKLLAVLCLLMLIFGGLFLKLETNNRALRESIVQACERRNQFAAKEKQLYLDLATDDVQRAEREQLYGSFSNVDCQAYRR